MQHASRDRFPRRLRRNPVLASGMMILLLLAICWPFVRQPALDLRETYFHLFGLWSALIALSWWLSRGLARGDEEEARR